jgi:plasmid stabilization system protein ParE
MKYTVVWKPSARQRLADVWIAAHDRGAVTSAADVIDRVLRDDPSEEGESRGGAARILIVPPLAVVYDVREEDRLVEVLSVRALPGQPEG